MARSESVKKLKKAKEDFDIKLTAIKKKYYQEIKKIAQDINDKKINKLKKELGI